MARVVSVDVATGTVTSNVSTMQGDGIASATITVRVLTNFGDPMPGRTVTLSVTGTGNTITQPATVTDANGETTGSFVSTNAATKTVSAAVLGVTLTDTASVVVSAASGSVATVTDISRDAANTGGGDTVVFDITGPVDLPTVTFDGVSATGITLLSSTQLQCIVPANTAGLADIVVGGVAFVNPRASIIGGDFEYLPVATTTFVDADFEGGTIPASLATDIGGGGSVTVQTAEKYAGTYAVKHTYNGTGPALMQNASGIGVSSETNGVYIRYYQKIPAASIAKLSGSGRQIKTYLSRISAGSGQPGWVMTGIGGDFGGGDDTLVSFVDNGILSITGGDSGVTPDVWTEMCYWQQWDAGNTRGNMKLWINGKLQFSTFNSAAGGTGSYFNRVGIAYTQNATGAVDVYIDEVFMGNGFPNAVEV